MRTDVIRIVCTYYCHENTYLLELEFVGKGVTAGRRTDQRVGGLVRSARRWSTLKTRRKGNSRRRVEKLNIAASTASESAMRSRQIAKAQEVKAFRRRY